MDKRDAFTCYTLQLPGLEKDIIDSNQKIINNLVSLDTPGKSTVEVVILADPVSRLFQWMLLTLILGCQCVAGEPGLIYDGEWCYKSLVVDVTHWK